jgi:hypothetical protein
MGKPDDGEANETEQTVDRLMDLLDEASLIAKNVKIGILDYIVGMAILEVSEQTKTLAKPRR